ncbi:hypothetical protein SKAU_G00405360 [Synaphobranchus kaupii]|uniref:C-type lectin domain-containing protein n=1 Tax=Synaphobranchus kaupii TaxID=118154 RepID=A0A9Q1EA05_SYNKA|nr:hypothetical protein SKAU_G00405360 [Synaphobranchus kaupii]
MDNVVYSNSEIVISHLAERREAGFFKGSQDFIYVNTVEQVSGGKRRSPAGSTPPSTAGTSGAPCRCAQVLLAVLCLALLAGLIALGVLYIQKSNRSDSLEEENSNLSISLSSVEQRRAGAEWELKELRRHSNVSDSAYRDVKTDLEELQVKHRDLLKTISYYADVKTDLEELQVKHRDLLKTISYYAAKEACVCPRGWKMHQGSCYYFSTEKMNWAQSQQYCISKEAHLVIVKDPQEQKFLSSNAGETRWIGLNDQETEGQWVWVDNTPLDKSATQFWWPKEPDNWTGGGDQSGEDCGSLGDHNGNFDHWIAGLHLCQYCRTGVRRETELSCWLHPSIYSRD